MRKIRTLITTTIFAGVLISCGISSRVNYTLAKDMQLYNFTEWVVIDSIQKGYIYCHDADNYRIREFNIQKGYELQVGDSMHLSNMVDPRGIEIMYNWKENKSKILK